MSGYQNVYHKQMSPYMGLPASKILYDSDSDDENVAKAAKEATSKVSDVGSSRWVEVFTSCFKRLLKQKQSGGRKLYGGKKTGKKYKKSRKTTRRRH